MVEIVATIASLVEPWRHAFNHSVVISTGVLFAHVSSLVCAGGLSLTADGSTLFAARREHSAREAAVTALSSHRLLATRALFVVLLSGVLLFLSDVDGFVHLRTFWLKMGLVALLITNSLLSQRQDDHRQRVHATASLTLWFLTLLAGTALAAG